MLNDLFEQIGIPFYQLFRAVMLIYVKTNSGHGICSLLMEPEQKEVVELAMYNSITTGCFY